MNYVLFFVCLSLQSPNLTGYLIVQDDHSSSESDGEQELSLKQRLDNLEASLAKLLENTEHRTNCSASPAPNKVCPDGWVSYNGSCYYFGRENITFEKAKEFCAGQNASLVHIETKDEDEFLANFQKTFTDRTVVFWLGLTDTETEGVWRWYDDNSKATYLGWSSTEPNDYRGAEDFALLSWYQSEGWIDLSCTTRIHGALCEKTYISA